MGKRNIDQNRNQNRNQNASQLRSQVMNQQRNIDQSETQTLRYYEANAEAFGQGTVHADMHETRDRFLSYLPKAARILDFGCGVGRDTKAFLDLGYQVDAIDGSRELCRLASQYTGIPVQTMLFQDLSAVDTYDGIWACASILHLPKEDLLPVMERIARALKSDGILYASFKYGSFEGMRNGRYFMDFTEESLAEFMKQLPSLHVFDQWITEDVRPERKEEKWINILARRS
jgi:2-polyprenyl-3-methyl-5-hydroxy-6-metoxy-1,4-benzoquinol methylase